MTELVNDSVLGENEASYTDPFCERAVDHPVRKRPRSPDPFDRFNSMHDSISMASVKERVLSFAKEKFPEREFQFVHFHGIDFLFKDVIMRDFLKEKSVHHERLNAFNHEYHGWQHSHEVVHLRDGSVKMINPV